MALPLTHGIGCILDALTAGTLQMVLINGIAFNSWHKLPKLKAHYRRSDVFAFYILAYIDDSAELTMRGVHPLHLGYAWVAYAMN